MNASQFEDHGIYLGREDLASCVDDGGLDLIHSSGLAFGKSTHLYSQLAAGVISLGLVKYWWIDLSLHRLSTPLDLKRLKREEHTRIDNFF